MLTAFGSARTNASPLEMCGPASPLSFLVRVGPTHRRAFGIPVGGIYLRARSEVTL